MKLSSVPARIWQHVFNGLRAITVQPYTEANVKRGLQFYANVEFIAVPVGTTKNIVFKTGAKAVIVKQRTLNFTGSSKLYYRVYEGVTYTGGTAVTVGNENRVSPEATTVLSVHTATLGSLPATYRQLAVYGASSGQGNNISRLGQDTQGLETILKANTTYVVTLENNAGSTGDIQFGLSWYEGGTDLPAEE